MSTSRSCFKILCRICCFAVLLSSCTGRKTDNSVRGSQASYILTATDLSRAYTSDNRAADAKYKDKVIFLTGSVDDIESDLMGGYSVSLRGGDNWYDNVSCKFPGGQRDYLVRLTRGNYVRLKGRCSGKVPALTLSDCILVDDKGAPLGD